MRDNLQMRVAQLKQSLAECPVPVGVSDEIKHILTTAPRMLGDIDRTIQSGNPSAIQQLAARIDYIETTIQWAVGTAKGANIAEAIASGREADATIPPEQRLLNRITRFLSTKMDGPQLAALWTRLAGIVDRWKTELLDQHPDATTVDFYRRYHARLVRKIADLSATHSSPFH